MAENENTEYEKLAKSIYETIHASEGIHTVNIQHNVLVKGKSGCEHQIDVYWEFKMAGETHRIAVECKNYSQNVSIGKIRDYFGVIHDIGNIKGILITKVGYQSGAIKFADYYGITLKELRFPTEKDWEGRTKNIHINMSIFSTPIKNRILDMDMEWIVKNTSFKEGDKLEVGFCMNNEIKIVDIAGKEITNLYELENKLPHNWKPGTDLKHRYDFEDAYLTSPNDKPMKIKGIEYTYDVISAKQETVIEGEKIAKAILKDIKTGNITFIDKKGNVK